MRAIYVRQEQNDMTRSDYEQAVASLCGFESLPDERRGPNWCKFRKGDVHVWEARHWVRARLVDGYYRFHTKHNTLAEALKGVNGTAYGPDSEPRRYALTTQPPEHDKPVLEVLFDLFPQKDDFVQAGMACGFCTREKPLEECWTSLSH